jgi:cobalt/nickel transport system permease protein
MAATGAGIFAAQMVNFPIGHGTSGHVLGAAVAAIALGPWCGMLTMAVVISAQCMLFGDGGTSALGANILNMAVVGTLVASGLYTVATRAIGGTKGKLIGTALAACGSVLAAAGLCSVELAASGTYAFADVLGAMTSVHALIGVSEALISVAIMAAALSVGSAKRPLSSRQLMFGGLAAAVAIAGLLAPLASNSPDGLERVAADLGFANLASENPWSVAPDYQTPGIVWPALAVALSGLAGVFAVFATTYTLNRTATAKVPKR